MLLLVIKILLTGAFFIEGALNLYWVASGKLPEDAVIPFEDGSPLFEPEPLITVAAGVLEWIAAMIVVLPGTRLKLALGALLLLRSIGEFQYIGFFKRVRGSRYAKLDTWLYSPLCFAQAAGIFWLVQFS